MKATEPVFRLVISYRVYVAERASAQMDGTLRRGVTIFLAIGGMIVIVLAILAFYNA